MKKTENNQNIDLYILDDYLLDSQREIRSEDCYMILFNRRSEMKILYENQRLTLATGNIVFVTPGTSFQIDQQTMEMSQNATLLIRFRMDFWNELIASSPEINYIYDMHEGERLFVMRTPPATWQGLYSAVSMLHTEYVQNNFCSQMGVKGAFITTMVHMNRTVYFQRLRTQRTRDSEILFKDMTYYIIEHYAEKISLDTMSSVFNISKSKITHLFKEEYNLSFYQFVLQQRLVHAKNAIISGMNISEVAYQCGFSEYTSFYKAFRKTFGMSPKALQMEYRMNVKTPEPF